MDFYRTLSDWLQHSPWPCPAIALLIFLESSPVVGLLIPGFLLIPALGSLSGQGLANFWTLLACSMVGAMLADSLGYWLGRLGHTRWHDHLGWKQSKRMESQAQNLFRRYGWLALFAGRIMWGIHPMIPMAAGVFGLSVATFYIVDLAAVFLWLLLHLGGGHWLGVLWVYLEPGDRPWLLLPLGLLLVILFAWRHRKEKPKDSR